MAGDWIKMRVDLLTHPKVVRMASALKADRLRVTGGLFAVWCLFDTHSTDGRLDGYTLDALDELVAFPGLGASMVAIEWLFDDGKSLSTPRFTEHNGQSAKRRGQETERKREARKVSAPDADKKRTREEKRREDSSVPSGTDSKPLQPDDSDGTTAKTVSVKVLVCEGVDKQQAIDWLVLRKAKRLPLTPSAWTDTVNEGAKVGLTPAETVAHAVRSNWAGFKASWYARDHGTDAQPRASPESFAERDERNARERFEKATGRHSKPTVIDAEFLEIEQ